MKRVSSRRADTCNNSQQLPRVVDLELYWTAMAHSKQRQREELELIGAALMDNTKFSEALNLAQVVKTPEQQVQDLLISHSASIAEINHLREALHTAEGELRWLRQQLDSKMGELDALRAKNAKFNAKAKSLGAAKVRRLRDLAEQFVLEVDARNSNNSQ